MIPFPARSFCEALGRQTPPGLINPWSPDQPGGEARQNALANHLKLFSPRFLFVSDRAMLTDAMATGVPLCCELSAQRHSIHGVSPYTREDTPSFDADSFRFWDVIVSLGIAPQSICFSAFPYVALPTAWRKIPDPDALMHHETRWVRNLSAWYGDLTVIAMGFATRKRLEAGGVPSRLVPRPCDEFFEASVRAILHSAAP